MTKTNEKKKVMGVVAAVLAMSVVLVSSLAVFTDQAEISGQTEAGKLAVSITAEAIDDQLLNEDFKEAVHNTNPGDVRDLAYVVTNEANKAMRVNDTLTLKVTPDAAYKDEGTAPTSIEDVKIHITGATLDEAASSFDATTGEYTLVYKGVESVLSGVGENAEIVEGSEAVSLDRAYQLVFDLDADNYWQGADITLDVQVDATQFANTNALADAGTFDAEEVVTDLSGAKI